MTPKIEFTIAGRPASALFIERLVSAVVIDQAGHESDSLTITLDDGGGILELPRKGVEVEVQTGYEQQALAPLGRFIVDETSVSGAPDLMVIRARAADLRSALRVPREFSWGVVTIGELVASIAARHGLEARVSEGFVGLSLGHIDQTESDINLLTKLARERDAVAKPVGNYLLFVKKGQAKAASGRDLSPVRIHRSVCSGWSASFPDRNRYTAVTAAWQNLETGQQVDVTVGDVSDGEAYRMRPVYDDQASALEKATARLQALTRGTSKFDFNCEGNNQLLAEVPVDASGFRQGVDGRWVIERVTHSVTNAGYRCAVQCERANGE